MTKFASRIQQSDAKGQRIDALAFYQGAHGIDPTATKEEIEARFAQDTLKEKEEPLRKLHSLEARYQQVKKERPEAEDIWERLRALLGDTAPPYFHGLSMAAFGLCALVVDVLVLAPSMDMLGVAELSLQYLVAAGFAALFTAWFEFSVLWYERARDALHKRTALVIGASAILTLLAWGWLRGRQLQYMASTDGQSLGGFLSMHPIGSAVFFILITVATPMVGACTFLWAWRDVFHAKTWRQARKRFDSLRKEEMELPRKIEAEAEQLANFERRKQEEAREMRKSFDQYYDRGQKNGARREPLWSVIWKAALGVLIGGTIIIADPALSIFAEILLPVIPGVGLFLYFNHRRLHPTPEQYLARENTKFAVIPESRETRDMSVREIRLLSKGDRE